MIQVVTDLRKCDPLRHRRLLFAYTRWGGRGRAGSVGATWRIVRRNVARSTAGRPLTSQGELLRLTLTRRPTVPPPLHHPPIRSLPPFYAYDWYVFLILFFFFITILFTQQSRMITRICVLCARTTKRNIEYDNAYQRVELFAGYKRSVLISCPRNRSVFVHSHLFKLEARLFLPDQTDRASQSSARMLRLGVLVHNRSYCYFVYLLCCDITTYDLIIYNIYIITKIGNRGVSVKHKYVFVYVCIYRLIIIGLWQWSISNISL